jgi:hypothetical protein
MPCHPSLLKAYKPFPTLRSRSATLPTLWTLTTTPVTSPASSGTRMQPDQKNTIQVARLSIPPVSTSAISSRIPFRRLRRLSSPASLPPSVAASHRSTHHPLRLWHRTTIGHHPSTPFQARGCHRRTLIQRESTLVSESVGKRSAGFAFSWSDTRVFECGLYNVRPDWRDVTAGQRQTRSNIKEDGVDNDSDAWEEELHGKRQT